MPDLYKMYLESGLRAPSAFQKQKAKYLKHLDNSLPLVSTTPAVRVAKFAAGVVDTGDAP
jgi:hypothetical protein